MKGAAGARSAIEVLACRNDLNRKGIVSLQLTADSSQLTAGSFYLLTVFLATVIDPSHSFRMTFNVSYTRIMELAVRRSCWRT